MSYIKYISDLNLGQNEATNIVLENSDSHPVNPKAGRIYFNTNTNYLYYWSGFLWIELFKNEINDDVISPTKTWSSSKLRSILDSKAVRLDSDESITSVILRDSLGTALSTVNLGYLAGGAYKIVYNPVGNTIDLLDKIGDVISSIALEDLVVSLSPTVNLNGSTLTLVDGATVISTVEFNLNSIEGLIEALNDKVDKSTSVIAGEGLKGGGNLSSSVEISISDSLMQQIEDAINAGNTVDGKQRVIEAGDNIQITRGSINDSNDPDVIRAKDTIYYGIGDVVINGTEVDLTDDAKDLMSKALTAIQPGDNVNLLDISFIKDMINLKQDILTEGDNISIDSSSVISAEDTTYTGVDDVNINLDNEIDLTESTKTDIEKGVKAYIKRVDAVSVTGDTNKTITITRQDGTILEASFLDNNDTEFPDDVINTLTFNVDDSGVLVAITSEGEIISVSLDGRYSLLGHSHEIEDIEGLMLIIEGKQDNLIAGDNITIDPDNNISAKDTTYNAGLGVNIDVNNNIGVNQELFDSANKKPALDEVTKEGSITTRKISGDKVFTVLANNDFSQWKHTKESAHNLVGLTPGNTIKLVDYDNNVLSEIDLSPLMSGDLDVSIEDDGDNIYIVFTQLGVEVGRINAETLLAGVARTGSLIGSELIFKDVNNEEAIKISLLPVLDLKQDNLVEGDNITIDINNEISATDTKYTGTGDVVINIDNEIDLTEEIKLEIQKGVDAEGRASEIDDNNISLNTSFSSDYMLRVLKEWGISDYSNRLNIKTPNIN